EARAAPAQIGESLAPFSSPCGDVFLLLRSPPIYLNPVLLWAGDNCSDCCGLAV
uniref:Uncharacterized protein n=1 Tax=Aegilops tauschii subsp. strangulata TaxID=200361 RepID=A0A453G368_AEGTS